MQRQTFWRFNLHRHNKLDESQVDYYVLSFEGVPGFSQGIYGLFKAPLGVKSPSFSLKQAIEGELWQAQQDFQKLMHGELGIGPWKLTAV